MRSIPMFDDFQALISFAVNFHNLQGLGPKLSYILAAQHDEYKLIFEHFIVGLQLTLSPHIHYRLLVVLGNLFVLASLAVYWFGYFRELPLGARLLRFAPISFLLVQLNYVETLDWAMCGLQMIPIIFFTLLALYFLTGRKGSSVNGFLLACLSAIVACLASANGFILGPVGLIFLLQIRAWRRAVAWFAPFAIALSMYLYQYHSISRDAVVHPTVFQKLLFFLSYLGSAIENMHHFPVRGGSIILGFCLFAAWIYSIRVGYHRSHPFAFYSALWVLICAAGVTQVRSKLGLDLSLTGRYKVYSDMLIIFAYAFGVHRFDGAPAAAQEPPGSRRRLAYCTALLFAALLNLSSAAFGYRFLKHRADTYSTNFRLYQADPEHVSPEVSLTADPITSTEPEFSRKVLNQAIAEGVFVPPANP